tara:strand:- start:2985 stop:3884 length:900 start_codon:yes stop_codon:yes gene_type:complete
MSSVSYLITKAKSFNANAVTYKPALNNKRGGKSVQLNLTGQPIVLQVPLMLTWGVNERVDEQSGRVTYDMALDFRNETASVLKFRDAMAAFEEKIKTDCIKNCKEWFGKSKMSRELVDNLMYPILKYPKLKDSDGNYTDESDYSRSPTLKVKLPFWEGRFNVELYNYDDKTPLYLPPRRDEEATGSPVECIPKASHVNGLIACQGLWFAGGRCGVTWKLVQACVRPPTRLLGTATCHIEDDSDDEEMEESLAEKEAQDDTTTQNDEDDTPAPSFKESSDEEEEEVKPKKKKKVVRRKKA